MNEQDKNSIVEELAIKYLTGEASAEECQVVEQWLEADPQQHRASFEQYRLILEEGQALKPGGPADTAKAWERFKQRTTVSEPIQMRAHRFRVWLAIAACTLVFFFISLYFYMSGPQQGNFTGLSASNEQSTKTFTATDQPQTDTLADGSMVTLTKNSSVTYQPDMYGHKRNVNLKGDAFFNVVHDAARPFQVRVNHLVINVLGTSFNIRSIGNQTEIIVATGVVGVSCKENSIQLSAGDKLIVTQGNTAWKKEGGAMVNLNRYPNLVKALLKNPGKWRSLLKSFKPINDTTTVMGRNRAIVRNILLDLGREQFMAGRSVQSFKLDNTELLINSQKQADLIYQRYKTKYLKQPGYTIYFGNAPQTGKGIFLRPDSL